MHFESSVSSILPDRLIGCRVWKSEFKVILKFFGVFIMRELHLPFSEVTKASERIDRGGNLNLDFANVKFEVIFK